MITQYANGFNLNINEVCFLQFTINTNAQNSTVASVVILYEGLKQIHAALGQAIQNHDAKLAKATEDKRKAN